MPTEPTSALSAPASSSNVKPEEKKSVESASPASAGGVDRAIDRATIARVVEHVLAAQGIARGSSAPKSAPAVKELPSPSSIATEIADRFFRSPGAPKAEAAANPSAVASSVTKTEVPSSPAFPLHVGTKPEPPAKPAIEISPFVSENDVRRAMTRSEKIFIGPKTILTPSARDLGLEHEVFVETEAGSIR